MIEMVVNFISGLIAPKADYMVYVVIAENPVPSFITTDSFINHCLSESIGDFSSKSTNKFWRKNK